jgi:hypothetical protein
VEGNEPIVHVTVVEFARPAYDQGDIRPGVIGPALATRESFAVVTPEDDNGVFGVTVRSKAIEDISDPRVRGSEVVVVASDSPTGRFGVREIWWHVDSV